MIEVCTGDVYAEGRVFSRLPIPDRCRSDQMQSFADILLKRGDGLAATVEDGLKNQQAVDAVLDSAEQGKWLAL